VRVRLRCDAELDELHPAVSIAFRVQSFRLGGFAPGEEVRLRRTVSHVLAPELHLTRCDSATGSCDGLRDPQHQHGALAINDFAGDRQRALSRSDPCKTELLHQVDGPPSRVGLVSE
jgi:hypothetical protein